MAAACRSVLVASVALICGMAVALASGGPCPAGARSSPSVSRIPLGRDWSWCVRKLGKGYDAVLFRIRRGSSAEGALGVCTGAERVPRVPVEYGISLFPGGVAILDPFALDVKFYDWRGRSMGRCSHPRGAGKLFAGGCMAARRWGVYLVSSLGEIVFVPRAGGDVSLVAAPPVRGAGVVSMAVDDLDGLWVGLQCGGSGRRYGRCVRMKASGGAPVAVVEGVYPWRTAVARGRYLVAELRGPSGGLDGVAAFDEHGRLQGVFPLDGAVGGLIGADSAGRVYVECDGESRGDSPWTDWRLADGDSLRVGKVMSCSGRMLVGPDGTVCYVPPYSPGDASPTLDLYLFFPSGDVEPGRGR